MKYIRTENELRESINDYGDKYPIADTIEELCDMFVGYIEINGNKEDLSIKMSDDLNDFNAIERFMFTKEGELYGAIWTDKGLIYVAKMNEEGELELL